MPCRLLGIWMDLGLKKEAGAREFCHWQRVIVRVTRMARSVAENLKNVASGV